MYYTLPIFATLLWAGNTIVSKLSSEVFSPIEISFYRWLLAFILITPFALMKVKDSWEEIVDKIPRLFILGVLGGVAYQGFAYYAAFYTTATNMGIIQATMPVMSMLLAFTFLNTRFKILSVTGILLSILGVLMVVTRGNLHYFTSTGVNFGDVLMVIATFSFALYSFLLQKWKMKMPVLVSIYLQALVASFVLLPMFLLVDNKIDLTFNSFSLVMYAAIGASIFAPLVWMMSIVKLGSERVSVFFNLIPVFITILATLLLKEPIDTIVITGVVISVSGLVISEVYR